MKKWVRIVALVAVALLFAAALLLSLGIIGEPETVIEWIVRTIFGLYRPAE